MPLYQVALRKAWDIPGIAARKWSNTFFVEAASATTAAAALVASWVSILRNAATDRVYAYEVYATDLLPTTTDFVTQAIPIASQRGTIATGSSGQPYLPKACIAVEMLVPNSRPSRKFWRPGLYEAFVENGQTVTVGIETAIRDRFTQFVEGISGLRDPDNEQFSGIGTLRLTTREFGRESTNLVPAAPPLG